MTLVIHAGGTQRPREVWRFKRSSTWWEEVVLSSFTSRDWMENFRVSRETFPYLCDQLKGTIKKQDTRNRRPVSVSQRVAITLWILATPCEYRTVAHLFGLARCTMCCIVKGMCRAMVKTSLAKYISFPVNEMLKEIMKGFKNR